MYAVIRTGGKQYRVEAGEQLEVERLGLDDGSEVELAPVLVVDGDTVQATPSQLDGAKVTARVVGATRGPKIDGFTPEQRLFLAYAQIWCQNLTPESMRLQVTTNPHSPGRYRVIGVMQNMPEFQKAFSCKAGQPLVPKTQCRVW